MLSCRTDRIALLGLAINISIISTQKTCTLIDCSTYDAATDIGAYAERTSKGRNQRAFAAGATTRRKRAIEGV